eukprot:3517197-Rhodomonas_salina.2
MQFDEAPARKLTGIEVLRSSYDFQYSYPVPYTGTRVAARYPGTCIGSRYNICQFEPGQRTRYPGYPGTWVPGVHVYPVYAVRCHSVHDRKPRHDRWPLLAV